jgi:hypothetical protein
MLYGPAIGPYRPNTVYSAIASRVSPDAPARNRPVQRGSTIPGYPTARSQYRPAGKGRI